MATKSTNKELIKKDNFMFIVILGVWFLLLLYFDPKIIRYIKWNESIWAILSILAFILCVNFFWLIGVYQVVIPLFSRCVAKPLLKEEFSNKDIPAVAILYPTMNDFQEEAVLSCIRQDYSNFKVYILDDSTNEEYKAKIDQSISKYPFVSLIRRENRTGFKAGNLNHALRKIARQYPYFVVSDADGVLQRDFIKRLVPYFALDESIGFVQTNQKINPKQKFLFSNYLQYHVDLHCKYYIPAKNQFGFVMFYGHGGMIRTDVWEKAGGFPNSVTEDLVFSSEIRKLGYRGIYVEDIICYEDFPQDYYKYRKRGERWVKGTAEYFLKWYPSILFSKNVPWFEKLDIVISAGRLLFAIPFAIFLFLVCVALPFSSKYTHFHVPIVPTFIPLYESISFYFSGKAFYVNWNFGFFVVMTIYGLSGFIVAVMEWYKKPVKMFGYMAQYTFVTFSTILFFFMNVLSLIFTRKRAFHVSGVKSYAISEAAYTMPLRPGYFAIFEILVAIGLIMNIIKTSNIWLAPIAVALAGNLFAYKFKWETPGIHILVILPFTMVLLIILIIGLSFI